MYKKYTKKDDHIITKIVMDNLDNPTEAFKEAAKILNRSHLAIGQRWYSILQHRNNKEYIDYTEEDDKIICEAMKTSNTVSEALKAASISLNRTTGSIQHRWYSHLKNKCKDEKEDTYIIADPPKDIDIKLLSGKMMYKEASVEIGEYIISGDFMLYKKYKE